ncbi:hypothetical protein ACIA8E_35570 [Streptomyces sp. NPDC051664]
MQALLSPAARSKTFELYNDPTLSADTDWLQQFVALTSDSGTG